MRSRRPAHPYSLLSILLCLVLLAVPSASALQGGGANASHGPKGKPPTKGAPGQNLPNLDDVRRRGPSHPKALPPVPSRHRKCPPDEPDCNRHDRVRDDANVEAPQVSAAGPSTARVILGALAASAFNPYGGVSLASTSWGLPEPPPARAAHSQGADAPGWLSSLVGRLWAVPAVRTPAGVFEYAGCDFVSGWAWDPAQPDTPIMVALFSDGQLVATVLADQYRADIAAGDGRHGFRFPLPDSLRDGAAHTLSMQVQLDGADTQLTSSPKATAACPLPAYDGAITSADCDQVTGWAWDSGHPTTPIDVDVYVDGAFAARESADSYDAALYKGDNRHRFRLATPAVARDGQAHSIAIRPAGSAQTLGPASSVTCNGPSYQGYLDYADCNVIAGWVVDWNRLNTPVSVDIYSNGAFVTTVVADNFRQDIANFAHDNGRHGFVVQTPDSLRDGVSHYLTARPTGSASQLTTLPSAFACSARAGCSASQSLPSAEFVKDFYLGALARQPKPIELQYWNDALRTAAAQSQDALREKAKLLGRELFLEGEYAGRGRMASGHEYEYVWDLYWGYLQRGPDATGDGFWAGNIQSQNSQGQNGWLNAVVGFEGAGEFTARVNAVCPSPADSVRSYDAVADFSPLQNPDGAWSYGYRAAGGAFTAHTNHGNIFGAGLDSWYSYNNSPWATRNNTGASYTYPNATVVVQPPDVINLHPGSAGERSVARWTASATGTYSIAGSFKGIDTVGTTTDVSVTYNGASVFSGNVSGYGATAPFSITRTVAAGETVEFSVGMGSNGNNNDDSTGLAVTISQPPPAQTLPYNNAAAQVPGTVEAELFDAGGDGVAYHDTTTGQQGQDYDQPPSYPAPSFRQPTDVDMYKSAATYSNGYLVLMQAGDWMNYTVDVAETGSYTLAARTWWNAVGGAFHLEADGVDVTGPVQLAGGSTWQLITKSGLQLNAGRHVLRLVSDSNSSDGIYMGDIDYLRLTADADAGLGGYWKFDEGSGSSAADSSGGGNGGTLQSGAAWGVARAGAASLSLDGVDDYVQVGARPGLVMTTTATFGAWIYPTGVGSSSLYGGVVLSKEGEYEVARYADGTIRWAFANTNPGWDWVNTGYVAPLNQWTHVAVTYDNGVVKTYANGQLVHTYNGSGSITDVDSSQNDFRVGGRQAGPQNFQGRLDDVRVYGWALSAAEVGALVAAAGVDPTGNDFSEAKKDPSNETGTGGDDPLSRNFNFTVPLVGLKGRAGLDLGLSLSYNSLVWTRDAATGAVKFDSDYGDPSPGFRMGFPVIHRKYRNARGENAYMLITSSGARTELRQVGTSNTYEATDSSYTQLTEDTGLTLRSADGSQLSFTLKGFEYKCTQIKDRNGNFITVSYNATGNATDSVSSITDTLGRSISFTYDANGRPLSIEQTRNGLSHQWATFGYAGLTMGAGFATGISVAGPANGTVISVLKRVSLDDGSFYNFLYNSWGQVYRVERRASDGSAAGRLLSYQEYDLLTPTSAQTNNGTDCPRFSQRKDFVKDWNNDAPVYTTYSTAAGGVQVIKNNRVLSGAQIVDTTDTVTQEITYGASNTWRRGLVTQVNTSWQNVLRRTAQTTWTQDDESLSYQLNPRVKTSEVSDPQGNHTGTTVDYTSFGLPAEAWEWSGTAANVLRHTHTEYDLDPAYVGRRVIGLVSSVSVYDEAGYVASKVDYTYDQGGPFLEHQGEPVQHDGANYGVGFVIGRGLLTSVRRWDVTALHDITKSVESRVGYNTTGSAIFRRDPRGHQETTSYTDRFSDKTGTSTLAYPTQATDPDGFSSKVEYSFDTGQVTRAEDPKGAQQTFTYDAAGRTVRVERSGKDATPNQVVSGGYTRWVYSDSMDAVQTWTLVDAGKPEVCSISVVDGVGRTRATASDFPGSSGGYRAQYTTYDIAGRDYSQSNPAEVNGLWNPVGDDAAGWNWTQQTYDWKGRPLTTTKPSEATVENSYGGCGCAGGDVVTLKGEMVPTNEPAPSPAQARRMQKVYHDALGREVKTELYKWDGTTVYSTITTKYDALDHPLRVRQYAGAAPQQEPDADGSTYQTVTMTYDGHGRLKTRHSPMQVGASNQPLATSYDYNADDSVQKMTDARGATTTYDYNGRGLPVTITYGVPQGSDISTPPSVTYLYDEVGHRTSMTTANGSGGSVAYSYDALSRLKSESRQFPGPSGTYTLSYQYTLSGALKSVTDQTSSTAPVSFSYDFDGAGQVTAVNSAGMGATAPLASNVKYRAWGALKHADYGPASAGINVNVGYDNRGRVTSYALGGVVALIGSTWQLGTEGGSFQYYEDGALKSASDYRSDAQTSGIQDRAYAYDHAGRIRTALSGSEARDFLQGTNSGVTDGPYSHSYTYDPWGNTRSRAGRYWSQDDSGMDDYDNSTGRHAAPWSYDADGRLISRSEPSPNGLLYSPVVFGYDAAGRRASTTQITSYMMNDGVSVVTTLVTQADTYDGDGAGVKHSVTKQVPGGPVTTETGYFLRSTLLGGRTISEYNSSGARRTTYAWAGGEVLAQQVSADTVTPSLRWEHLNPVTGDGREVDASGTLKAATHLDPDAVDVGESDPATWAAVDPSIGGNLGGPAIEDSIAKLISGYGGMECTMDYILTDCRIVRNANANGATKPDPNDSAGGVNALGQVWVSNWADCTQAGVDAACARDDGYYVDGSAGGITLSTSITPQNPTGPVVDSSDMGPPPPLPNPNCIERAVPDGKGKLSGRGLEEAISAATGKPVHTNLPAHNGEHVLISPGTKEPFIALPAMAGTVLHGAHQSGAGTAGYIYAMVDILLDSRIDGQQYVMTLTDHFYDGAKLSGRVRPGDQLGTIRGSDNPRNESGMHVTLVPYSVWKEFIGNKKFASGSRDKIPFNALMGAGTDPRSPFKCP